MPEGKPQAVRIKGAVLSYLLSNGFTGDRQCPKEKLIQAVVPRDKQKLAKDAVEGMQTDPTIPVWSGGGGSRNVYHIEHSRQEKAKELAQAWDPDYGEDSEPEDELSFEAPHQYTGVMYTLAGLCDAGVDIEKRERLCVTVTGTGDDVSGFVEQLCERTNGDLPP